MLRHGWVDSAHLERALAEQRHTQRRLCSMLIARGLLDPDHASRALGEKYGCAAVLQKHLEHRDRELVAILPAGLARAHFALPIGRKQNGEVIVCVRDPDERTFAAVRRATTERIVFAVAPATQLERLIEQSYEPTADEEFEVDLTTGPISPIADVEDPLLGAFALVELDDHSVAKDFSQVPLPNPREARPSLAKGSLASLAGASIERTLEDLDATADREAAIAVAMNHAVTRWHAALLFAIREGAAHGEAGHGVAPETIAAVKLPLTASTLVKNAHVTRQLATDAHRGPHQDRLLELLGHPAQPRAVPVVVGPRVAQVLVVGDPRGDAGQAARELERLAAGLGATLTRIVRDPKR